MFLHVVQIYFKNFFSHIPYYILIKLEKHFMQGSCKVTFLLSVKCYKVTFLLSVKLCYKVTFLLSLK